MKSQYVKDEFDERIDQIDSERQRIMRKVFAKRYPTQQSITKSLEKYKEITISSPNQSPMKKNQYQPIIAALKEFAPKSKKNIYLTLTDTNGSIKYVYVNQNSLNELETIVEADNFEVRGTEDPFTIELINLASISVGYRAKSRSGAYFPFWNKSGLDLTKYGIYSEHNPAMNQSCLVTAFENAKVLAPIEERNKNTNSRIKNALDDDGNEISFLTETELNLLKSSIHSRDALNDFLKDC